MLQQVWICLTLVLLKLAERIFSHSLNICTYTPSRLCQKTGIQQPAYVKSIYNSILSPQAKIAAIQSFSLYSRVRGFFFVFCFFFFSRFKYFIKSFKLLAFCHLHAFLSVVVMFWNEDDKSTDFDIVSSI